MLLFIGNRVGSFNGIELFQNIVCYCLSGDPEHIWNKYGHFKTSYVTVYQALSVDEQNLFLFQNIVCYCLSCSSGTKTTMVFSFQNIVCYCLSFLRRTSSVFKLISKHRMLLFILLFEPSLEQLSHISKHRMLLFIWRLDAE